ncbi:MAG: hypothetical protein PUG60_09005 [Lachnospiraceae bacterium]|nr:hypothetical protein [Lachnospiraceae bacterium]MDY4971877.1 hypothetical protein [Lachnospiraceae bacterium]
METLKKGYCFEGADQRRLMVIGEAVSHESGQTVYLCQELTAPYRLTVWTAGEIAGCEDAGVRESLSGTDSVRTADTVQSGITQGDQEQLQQNMMLRFLEASSCSEKLEILDMMKGKLTDSMLESMAISMDYELGGGSVEEKYYALERFLKTRNRYEGTRLR